ncbi:Putative cytochrome c oxidase subunit 6b-like [Linum grandiflorum]
MSAAQVDPHDKMRSRDVNKVARGEQAPRPAHEPGQISQRPSQPSPDPRHYHHDDDRDQLIHKEKDEDEVGECEKLAKYYRALCPSEWIERWNEQREQGIFPGPI